MRIRVLCLLALCAALAACDSVRRDRVAFDGQYFSAKARKAGDDRRTFTVDIRPAAASLDGAREAGRFEATKYCIENYGNSGVVWTVGPDDDPGSYVLQGDSLILQGTCQG